MYFMDTHVTFTAVEFAHLHLQDSLSDHYSNPLTTRRPSEMNMLLRHNELTLGVV